MTTHPPAIKIPPHLTLWVTLAFLYVYLAWGCTYLGVHYALESMPPFLLAGTRFLLAGGILMGLLGIFHARNFHWGTIREWKDAGVVGTLLILGGNGGLVWAQQYVVTSVAALIFGSMPLGIILFDWIRPGGTAPSLRTALGLILGFIGLCVLFQTPANHPDSRLETWGKLALLFAALSWSAGAIYSRHVHARGSSLLPMARQMIIGGLALLIVSVPHGDWHHFSLQQVTPASWLGFAYLLIFGSLFGFTAYVWLMRVSTPARVSTISYVNIVIAVIVGVTIAREPMTLRILLGAGIIVSAVVLVLKKPSTRAVVNEAPTEG
jgi:drug/metabolite transporter (DMT)-like permease